MNQILCDDKELPSGCDNPKSLAVWKLHDLTESTLSYLCQYHANDWLAVRNGHKVEKESAADWMRLSPSEAIRLDEY
jgi:hypothetical protein